MPMCASIVQNDIGTWQHSSNRGPVFKKTCVGKTYYNKKVGVGGGGGAHMTEIKKIDPWYVISILPPP
jgi:hypothetical protein